MSSALFLHPWPFCSQRDVEALMDHYEEDGDTPGAFAAMQPISYGGQRRDGYNLTLMQKTHLSHVFGWTNPGVVATFSGPLSSLEEDNQIVAAAAATGAGEMPGAPPGATMTTTYIAYSDVDLIDDASPSCSGSSSSGSTSNSTGHFLPSPRALLGTGGLIKLEALVVKAVHPINDSSDSKMSNTISQGGKKEGENGGATLALMTKEELARVLLHHAAQLPQSTTPTAAINISSSSSSNTTTSPSLIVDLHQRHDDTPAMVLGLPSIVPTSHLHPDVTLPVLSSSTTPFSPINCSPKHQSINPQQQQQQQQSETRLQMQDKRQTMQRVKAEVLRLIESDDEVEEEVKEGGKEGLGPHNGDAFDSEEEEEEYEKGKEGLTDEGNWWAEEGSDSSVCKREPSFSAFTLLSPSVDGYIPHDYFATASLWTSSSSSSVNSTNTSSSSSFASFSPVGGSSTNQGATRSMLSTSPWGQTSVVTSPSSISSYSCFPLPAAAGSSSEFDLTAAASAAAASAAAASGGGGDGDGSTVGLQKLSDRLAKMTFVGSFNNSSSNSSSTRLASTKPFNTFSLSSGYTPSAVGAAAAAAAAAAATTTMSANFSCRVHGGAATAITAAEEMNELLGQQIWPQYIQYQQQEQQQIKKLQKQGEQKQQDGGEGGIPRARRQTRRGRRGQGRRKRAAEARMAARWVRGSISVEDGREEEGGKEDGRKYCDDWGSIDEGPVAEAEQQEQQEHQQEQQRYYQQEQPQYQQQQFFPSPPTPASASVPSSYLPSPSSYPPLTPPYISIISTHHHHQQQIHLASSCPYSARSVSHAYQHASTNPRIYPLPLPSSCIDTGYCSLSSPPPVIPLSKPLSPPSHSRPLHGIIAHLPSRAPVAGPAVAAAAAAAAAASFGPRS
ncbi:Hypothetical protein NocV09_01001110 [Nannochloropsis oceanica]